MERPCKNKTMVHSESPIGWKTLEKSRDETISIKIVLLFSVQMFSCVLRNMSSSVLVHKALAASKEEFRYEVTFWRPFHRSVYRVGRGSVSGGPVIDVSLQACRDLNPLQTC